MLKVKSKPMLIFLKTFLRLLAQSYFQLELKAHNFSLKSFSAHSQPMSVSLNLFTFECLYISLSK